METIITTKRAYSVVLKAIFILTLITIQSCVDNKKDNENNTTSEEENVAEMKKVEKSGDGKIHIMKPEEGDHYWVGAKNKDTLGTGGELTIYVDPETHPEANASFAKYSMGVGGALPTHMHEKTEELAYIVSGEGLAQNIVNNELIEIPIKAGYVWYNPPATWHSFKNTGDEPLVLVFAVVPNDKNGLLSFFRKIGTVPGKEASPMSPEEFGKLASEHDMKLRPPTKIE